MQHKIESTESNTIIITYSDHQTGTCKAGLTAQQAIAQYDAKLAKRMVAARVAGQVVDVHTPLTENAQVIPVMPNEADGLEILRHSCAHLMAQAISQLFPGTRLAIGPVIDNGFYYDVDCGEQVIKEEDLPRIEKCMRKLVAKQIPIERQLISRRQALDLFRGKDEHYKVEIIDQIEDDAPLVLYQQGEFIDLCRGPHVPHTGHLRAFKLQRLSGAYWRGDSDKVMLQRVYGTAWADKGALQDYLDKLEQAKVRDHRGLAKKMDLFHLQGEAPGMVFWHPNGWKLYQLILQYMRRCIVDSGYEEVNTPQLVDVSLWKRSGHIDKFSENMFFVDQTNENRRYAIKPMNCPCHVQLFNQKLRSHRDLPLRLAEFGSCHRYEPSGTLHGLLRVRNFVQDDGHIFCTEEQIQQEVSDFLDLLQRIYKNFGFQKIIYRLSTRPEERIGLEESWDKAELALQTVLDNKGIAWELCEGEGAFYGPKIEFSLQDCLDRIWQCGTIQVDFCMAKRFDAYYIAKDGSKCPPVILHRAVLGTFERFIGILIEETAGLLPFWLAPVQVAVLTVSEKHHSYAEKLQEDLKKLDIRVKLDLRDHKIGYKIREHSVLRVPYLLIVGQKEVDTMQVSVRTQAGDHLGIMSIEGFLAHVKSCL